MHKQCKTFKAVCRSNKECTLNLWFEQEDNSQRQNNVTTHLEILCPDIYIWNMPNNNWRKCKGDAIKWFQVTRIRTKNKGWKVWLKIEQEQRRLNQAYNWKRDMQWDRFFEFAPKKATWGHRYELFKKPKERLGLRFFCLEVVILQNELGHSTASVDTVTAFKKLGRMGC